MQRTVAPCYDLIVRNVTILLPGELAAYPIDPAGPDDATLEVIIRGGEPRSAASPKTLRAHVSSDVTYECCFWFADERIIWSARHGLATC